MPPHHSTGSIQALYRVFILPNLTQSTHCQPVRSIRPPPHPQVTQAQRPFTTTHASFAKPAPQPEIRAEKWDEEITAQTIYLIDPATNKISEQPQTRFDVLSRLDRTTHRLVQYPNSSLNDVPVCRIVNKKEAYQRAQRVKEESKERKKLEDKGKSVKTLELNWAMDPNDLGHRLSKVEEFLKDGRKVEVILASKKRGRKASVEECKDVLSRIRGVVGGVEGAKEAKGMEGKVGGFATMFFQGRAQAVAGGEKE